MKKLCCPFTINEDVIVATRRRTLGLLRTGDARFLMAEWTDGFLTRGVRLACL
jgi:hypothetical protein